MVQTCVVACSSLAFSGGFGCYLLSMDAQTFRNLGSLAGNRPQVGFIYYQPSCQWTPIHTATWAPWPATSRRWAVFLFILSL